MSSEKDVSIWLPIYIGEMLSMTTRLTTEQIGGLYLLMLDYWKNGAIPNDNKIIGAITRLPASKVKLLKESIFATGIFAEDEANNIIYSPYLDDKKNEATDNKKMKSEKAKKAAEARWGNKDNQSPNQNDNENSAIPTHDVSNANAMHKHNISNAQSMLDECPLSLSSSIINTHSQAGENEKSQNQQSEQIRFDRMQDIQNWQAPSLDEMQQTLRLAGSIKVLNQQEYDLIVNDFRNHHAEQALIGKPLITENLRKDKLRKWIMNERTFSNTGKTHASNQPTTKKPTTTEYANQLGAGVRQYLDQRAERTIDTGNIRDVF